MKHHPLRRPSRLENPLPADLAAELADRVLAVLDVDPTAPFDALQEATVMALRQVGAVVERRALEARVTRAERIAVDGVDYRALSQPSAVRCFGLWGTYRIAEPLYRAIGEHNGPTIKPLAKRVGMICDSLSPAYASRLGSFTALMTSRQAHRSMFDLGVGSASRATIEKLTHDFGTEMADQVLALEEAARLDEEIPLSVASLSCGLDRKAVPMHEERPSGQGPSTPRRPRQAPYVRAVPSPFDVNYRMAYVASLSLVDADGKTLRTLRYGMDANIDPAEIAARVVKDIERVVKVRGVMPITIVQDGALELDVLPEALAASDVACACPRHEVLDLIHALDYLREVVRACHPAGDPRNMGEWYRAELLRDDAAIDRILRSLRRHLAKTSADKEPDAHEALTDAVRYLGKRKAKLRYATHRNANRVIGSGATESAAKVFGQRTNVSGARWEVPGLRGAMARRGLVTSERWTDAWEHYAGSKKAEIMELAA